MNFSCASKTAAIKNYPRNIFLVKSNIFVLEQAVGPGVLQTFSTRAVKQ